MKIAVINGSPKGKYSITLQTVEYLLRKYPEHKFTTLHAGQTIKALEKDFSKAKTMLEESDAVLFSYPVYTFLAPSQLHRFIELLKENKVDLKDKYATQISTSKHFYDVTAHKYIEENSLDLGMRYIKGLSADMDDLLCENGRSDAVKFFDRFLWSVKENVYTVKAENKSIYSHVSANIPEKSSDKLADKDIVIITDCKDSDHGLSAMIHRFESVFPYKTRTVNISVYPFTAAVSDASDVLSAQSVFTRTDLIHF